MNTMVQTPMALPRKRRIALGVFDSRMALKRALAGLADVGIGPAHLVLFADQGGDPTALASQFRNQNGTVLAPVLSVAGRDELVAAGLIKAVSPEVSTIPVEPGGMARMDHSLNAHLDRGACVLMVSIDDMDTEKQVLGVLLATSIHQVQLHDLLTPVAAAAPLPI